MDRLLVNVDKEEWERLVSEHGSVRSALDYITLRLDTVIRTRRRARPVKEEVMIEVPLRPNLMPILDNYCVQFETSRKEVVNSIIKRKKIKIK